MSSPIKPEFVPLIQSSSSVAQQMGWVLVALIPAIGVSTYCFGVAILVSLALTTATAVTVEALMVMARKRSVKTALSDGSAVVTACLISLSVLPILPWWTVLSITAFAMIVKHLYGGLGQNPFNPAMAAVCFLVLAFPAQTNRWYELLNTSDANGQIGLIFESARAESATSHGTATSDMSSADTAASATPRTDIPEAPPSPVDTIASATPLSLLNPAQLNLMTVQLLETDYLRQILLHHANLWLSIAYVLGGLLLIAKRIIPWRLPLAFLVTIAVVSTLFWLGNPTLYAPPYFHLVTGGTMIGAFFIITDPVTGATTPKGQILFAIGAGLIVSLIRGLGPYPDGVAFSVLLMNLCAPLLDRLTAPKPFGRNR